FLWGGGGRLGTGGPPMANRGGGRGRARPPPPPPPRGAPPPPLRRHARPEAPIVAARASELPRRSPEPHRQAGQLRRTHGGGLHQRRPLHRDTQEIGLELHQEVVRRCSAV